MNKKIFLPNLVTNRIALLGSHKTLSFNCFQTMCSSRKYPYPPPTEGIFPMTPLPSGNSVFVAHPLGILSFLVETKNKIFFLVQDAEF